ncbi:MAG TPA: hypothetical protein VM534_08350, partial [Thermoanaerobaculia bacterium]|nr:hypothetical protein [Thermoanaerobaculia bacterium]
MTPLAQPMQRGFANVAANWPLLLILVIEGFAQIALLVGSLLLALVPAGVAGILFDPGRWDDDPVRAAQWVLEHPLVIAGAIGLLLLGGLMALVLHAFVTGATTGCYVAGERAAGAGLPARERFAAFTVERWMAEGKRTWWPLFLIYNITWGLFGLILLAPVLLALVVILAFPESPVMVFA